MSICVWKATDWFTPSYSFHVSRSDDNRIGDSAGGSRQQNPQCLTVGSGEVTLSLFESNDVAPGGGKAERGLSDAANAGTAERVARGAGPRKPCHPMGWLCYLLFVFRVLSVFSTI